jgi:hypothetical protein
MAFWTTLLIIHGLLWTPERRGPAMYWYGDADLPDRRGRPGMDCPRRFGAVGAAGHPVRLCRRGRLTGISEVVW